MNAAKLIELIKQLITQAVGKSEKETQEFVKKQINELPVTKGEKGDKGDSGKDGVDGKDAVLDIEELCKRVSEAHSFNAIKESLTKALETLQQKTEEIKNGVDGKDGEKGADGKDAPVITVEDVCQHLSHSNEIEKLTEDIKKALETLQEKTASIKDGRDGVDGKDAPPVDIKSIQDEIIKTISGLVDEEIKRAETFSNSIPEKIAEFEEAFKKQVEHIQHTCGQWMDSVESRLKDLILPIVKSVIGEQKLLTEGDKESFESLVSKLCKRFDENMDVLQKALEGANQQIKNLQEKNLELETDIKSFSNGQDGQNGKDGIDGKDAIVDYKQLSTWINDQIERVGKELEGRVNKAVNGIVNGKDGLDAVVDYEKLSNWIQEKVEAVNKELETIVTKAISEIKNGTDGKDGVDGKDAVIDYAKLTELAADSIGLKQIREELKTAIKSVVNGADGKDGIDGKDAVIDYDKVSSLISGQIESVVKEAQEKVDNAILSIKNGENGINGQDGRDALEIQILDVVDLSKQYPRGTYATINGGLYKAFKSTDPVTDESKPIEKFGWSCVVKGIKSFTTQFNEETNEISLNIIDSEGKSTEQTVKFNPIIYKGVWREQDANEKPFGKNNSVTYNGGLWISLVDDNKSRPGEDKSWQLAVKKGRDGKDGSKGSKGDKGDNGNDGRDLTRVDENGGKY